MNNAIELYFPALGQSLGWTLFHSLWQLALIAVLLKLCLRFISPKRPNLRYWALVVGMFMALVVAAYTFTTEWQLFKPAVAERSGDVVTFQHFSEEITLSNSHLSASAKEIGAESFLWSEVFSKSLQLMDPYMPFIGMLWMAGVLIFLSMMISGFFYLHHLKSNGVVKLSDDWMQRFEGLKQKMGVRQTIRLLSSTEVSSPVAFRMLKPVILIPLGLLANLTPLQVEVLILHELAHIRRYDFWVNLVQSLIEVLFFFHPAMWWISGQVRAEREHCCDELVLKASGDAVLYAQTLTQIQAFHFSQKTKLIMAANAQSSLLSKRIFRLFGKYDQQPSLAKSLFLTFLLLLGLTLPAFYSYGINEVEKFSEPEKSISKELETELTADLPADEVIAQNTMVEQASWSIPIEEVPFEFVPDDNFSPSALDSIWIDFNRLLKEMEPLKTGIQPLPSLTQSRRYLRDTVPLFILDGEETPGLDGDNLLNRVDPKSIESITVIKGKAALEKYGEKGKHGVIIIKTKGYAKKREKSEEKKQVSSQVKVSEEYDNRKGVGKVKSINVSHLSEIEDGSKLKGIVRFDNGKPAIGAIIQSKDKAFGAVTDVEGKFSLTATDDCIDDVELRYVGYAPASVKELCNRSAFVEFVLETPKKGKAEIQLEKAPENIKAPIIEVEVINLLSQEKRSTDRRIIGGTVKTLEGEPVEGIAFKTMGKVLAVTDKNGAYEYSLPVVKGFDGKLLVNVFDPEGTVFMVSMFSTSSDKKFNYKKMEYIVKYLDKKKAKQNSEVKNWEPTSEVNASDLDISKDFALNAFPNPAKEQVTIEFQLDQVRPVVLEVYQNNGQLIKTLYNDNKLNPGKQRFTWYPERTLNSGIYIIRLRVEDVLLTRQIVIE